MLGLEPGDELLATRGLVCSHEAEADEGVHLVNVAAHGFAPLLKLAHVAIRGHGKEVAFATVRETPNHTVEHSPAPRVAVRAHAAGDVEKCGRDFRHRAPRGCIVCRGEKSGLLRVVRPQHFVGPHAQREQFERTLAPFFEVRLDDDRSHGYSSPERTERRSLATGGGGAPKSSST